MGQPFRRYLLLLVAVVVTAFGLNAVGAAPAAAAIPAQSVSVIQDAQAANSCSMTQNGRSVAFSCFSGSWKRLHAEVQCTLSKITTHTSVWYERSAKFGWRNFTLTCPPLHVADAPGWYFY